MANKEIVDYIKNELKKSFSLGRIKKKLVETGYTKDVVESAAKKAVSEAPPTKLRRGIGGKYVIILLVILVALAGTLYLLTKIPKEDVGEEENISQCIEGNEDRSCMALAMDDISFCKKPDMDEKEKERCSDYYYERAAFKKEDSLLCGKVVNSTRRLLCEAVVNKDSSKCENADDKDFSVWCGSVIARDINSCNGIKKTYLKVNCKDTINFIIAYTNQNISFCKEIRDSFTKNICLALLNQDPSFCKREAEIE